MKPAGALTPEDYAELSTLFDELSELPPAARAHRLDSLRAQGHALVPRLARMLAAAQGPRTDELMPPTPKPRAMAARQAGERIGPWRLVAPLGSGGMAEVWRAVRDDGQLKREVALKLPFPVPGPVGETRAQRFARERDILAALRHPHIAALLDAGVETDGQAWLALELVEGTRITEACDARRLTLSARVALFRQVLLAVQHAHAQLVIHRDLKPANVLVTQAGEVRLLDFGIAKLLAGDDAQAEDTALTQQAGHPLTPRYASPEQLRGEALSTASDVYALGVLLHELLTGRLPYAAALRGAAALERAMADADVALPSRTPASAEAAAARSTTPRALQRTLAPELDAVLLRALARRPADRYRSVDALLDDLDRWLAGLPVRARTPSVAFRLRRFVARHPWGVAAGSTAVVGLVMLSIMASWFGWRANEASQRAVLSRDFLLEMLGRAESQQHRRIDISAREMLAWGRQRAVEMPATPAQRADLLLDIARAQAELTDYLGATATLDDLAPRLAALGRREDLAQVQIQRVEMALRVGDLARAAERLAEARRAMPAVAGLPLQARMAQVEGWHALMAGDAAAAMAHDARAASAAARAWAAADEARVLIRLQQARSTAAAGQSERALALLGSLIADLGDPSPATARQAANAEYVRATIEIGLGRFGAVAGRLEPAIARCEAVAGPAWETCPNLRRMLALAWVRLGERAAAASLAAAMRVDAQAAVNPVRRHEAQLSWAHVLTVSGRIDWTAPPWPAVLELAEGRQSDPMPGYLRIQAQQRIAEARLRSGDAAQAQRWIESARRQLAAERAPSAQQQLRNEALAAAALGLTGAPADAARRWAEVQARAGVVLGAQHPLTWLYALNGVPALLASDQPAQAQALLDQALPVLEAALGRQAPIVQRAAGWRRDPRAARPAAALDLSL